jgi:hypothetical protein
MERTEDQPEPQKGDAWWSLVGLTLMAVMFLWVVPRLVQLICDGVWALITANDYVEEFLIETLEIEGVSWWISFFAFGYIASLFILRYTFKRNRAYFYVDQGHVQFVRFDIGGWDWVLKLDGGYSVPPIPFLFSKWDEQWRTDQKWQVTTDCIERDSKDPDNEKKEKRTRFRVSVGGQDIELSAVATVRPDRDHLLPLHLLDNDSKKRETLAVKNLRSALMRSIEQVITTAEIIVRLTPYPVIKDGQPVMEKNGRPKVQIQEKVIGIKETDEHGNVTVRGVPNYQAPAPNAFGIRDVTRGFRSIEEVVSQGENLSAMIEEEFAEQEIVARYGLLLDTFSLGEIDLPEKVAERRDHAAGMATMMEEAKKQAEGSDGSVSQRDLLRVQQLAAKDISESSTTTKGGLDTETLDAIKQVVELITGILARFGPSRGNPGPNPIT